MSQPATTPTHLRFLLLLACVCGPVLLPGLSPGRPAALLASPLAEDGDEGLIDEILGQLEPKRSSIQRVLLAYSAIEARERLSLFGRHRLHEKLVQALAKMDSDELVEVVDAALDRRSLQRSRFPANVVLLKTLVSGKLPMPRPRRIAVLAGVVRDRDLSIATWAVRLLGASGWPEAIDALIAILREEEEESRHLDELADVVSEELYHLLGARGGSGAMEKAWKEFGRKLPKDLKRDEVPEGGTGFFGDRVALRSVFAIDISSSMKQLATRPATGRTSAGGARDRGKGEPKIEIVRAELLRAIASMRPETQFNIVPYDGEAGVWHGEKLLPATSGIVKRAEDFVRALETGSGTNIHDAMVRALQVPEVGTVYLLSDGEPSRGGDAAAIERRVGALNYLRGIRVVTYGFKGSDDKLMRTLAEKNWGWYRPLD